jgi:surface polysaccharide O-acyltransferase-like enzyme
MPGARLTGIDALRYVLAFAVVVLHTIFESRAAAPSVLTPSWPVYLEMACRAAVPFFFIAGGYFLVPGGQIPGNQGDRETLLRPLLRLLPLYVAWKIFYYLFLIVVPAHPLHLGLRQFLWNFPVYHLWFLPALAFALALVPLALKYLGLRKTFILCAALALVSLMEGAWRDLFHLTGGISRARFLVAPMFVLTGVMLARYPLRLSTPTAVLLVLVSYLALAGEETLLARLSHGAPLASHEFMLATFPYGVAVFLLWRPMSGLRALGDLGRFSLNIYTSHLMFVWLFGALAGHPDLPGALGLVAIPAFAAATLTSLVLEYLSRHIVKARSKPAPAVTAS